MENKPERYAKLDMYDYYFKREQGHITNVLIGVDSNYDVDIADISSDITACDGNVYVEGHYLRFHEIRITEINGKTYIDIVASEV